VVIKRGGVRAMMGGIRRNKQRTRPPEESIRMVDSASWQYFAFTWSAYTFYENVFLWEVLLELGSYRRKSLDAMKEFLAE